MKQLKYLKYTFRIIIKLRQNFLSTVKKIPDAINVWNTRALTLERRILIFKALGTSSIVYLSLITVVPISVLNEIQKTQKSFSWYSSKPKITYQTLCDTFEVGGLKNVDIKAKIISLHCSWVKKIFDNNHHDCKIIPLFLK